MSGCCNEYRCRRKQPVRILQGPFGGAWYVVIRYREWGDGLIEAIEKHELDEPTCAMLNAALAAQGQVGL